MYKDSTKVIAWRVFQGEKLLNKLLGCPLMVSLLTGTTK
jgi:hypothetical protein